MKKIFLMLMIISVVACSTTQKLQESDARQPASDDDKWGDCLDHKLFNGRRLLALNKIVALHTKRLAERERTPETLIKIQTLGDLYKRTTYPAVDANTDYRQISTLLDKESETVLKMLRADDPGDKQVAENITYLDKKFIPNIRVLNYWCPTAKSSSSESADR